MPPTWRLADGLVSEGFKGLLFPSIRYPSGINLVLFTGNLTADDHIQVVDPEGTATAQSALVAMTGPGAPFEHVVRGSRSIEGASRLRLPSTGLSDPPDLGRSGLSIPTGRSAAEQIVSHGVV